MTAHSTQHTAHSTQHPQLKGFTLSELLVSLSVLGLIAALTLPSIFNSLNLQKRRALFKDTMQVIAQAHYEGFINGDITVGSNRMEYLVNKLNAVYTQETACTEGYHVVSIPNNHRCAVLPTGVMVNFRDAGTDMGVAYVDINGSEGPNSPGPSGDRFYLGYYSGETLSVSHWGRQFKPGEVNILDDYAAGGMYDNLFN
jgi:prepilin-type N-terminal cleavage/methylation domain-containing protein